MHLVYFTTLSLTEKHYQEQAHVPTRCEIKVHLKRHKGLN